MNEETLRVGPDRRITLHFSVMLVDGSIIDSTRDRDAATFQYGDGNLLPGFEQAIQGLKAGDRRSVIIEAEKGFGVRNEANIQEIPRQRFSDDMVLEKGVMVSFANAGDGGELPGVVERIEGDNVIVDFNHPLAGRDLTFEVEIVDVVPAVQAVEVKMASSASDEGGQQ